MIVLIIDNYTYVVFDEENDEDHMVILLLYQHYDGASANALHCNALQCWQQFNNMMLLGDGTDPIGDCNYNYDDDYNGGDDYVDDNDHDRDEYGDDCGGYSWLPKIPEIFIHPNPIHL